MLHQGDGDKQHHGSEDLRGFHVVKASGFAAPCGIKAMETSGVEAPRCLREVLRLLVSARMSIPCPSLGISMQSSMQRAPGMPRP